jgi:hypothetical protein
MQTNNHLKIDHAATVERCKLINRNEVARQCGVSAPVVLHVLRGDYPYPDSEAAQRIIAKIRELGLLVEVDVNKAA